MTTTKLNKIKNKSNFSTDMVRTYLHEIGQVPLLTHEEEIIYGKQVQRMMTLLSKKAKLEKTLGHSASLQELAEAVGLKEDELKQSLLQGQRAKRKMIEANLRLVVAIAKKYQRNNLEFLDMIQEGSLGLERGVEKFDPTKGYRFSTYAYWWIRQAITRAISQQGRTIRLPIHVTEKLSKIKKAQRELAQKLGRPATPSEIARELDLEPAQIREYYKIARNPISLDVRVGDNQDTELSEMLQDDEASPEEYTTGELMRQDIQKMLADLSPQEQRVLSLRFGLEDGKEKSLAQIGQRLNLSRERVRQLESRALEHLRKKHSLELREYLAS
ncbi:RNA polymerase sigma factor, RpoD/SigA family [Pleurocapsales cyanobacterium LEGE 06147]|nr:RNA polymerase sigma factor, RpoD/SigA family [Pleurocapsales cyanobacterium LEGE 06147]